jgi:hypothetical protein
MSVGCRNAARRSPWQHNDYVFWQLLGLTEEDRGSSATAFLK